VRERSQAFEERWAAQPTEEKVAHRFMEGSKKIETLELKKIFLEPHQQLGPTSIRRELVLGR
jgi:hypothetical protein